MTDFKKKDHELNDEISDEEEEFDWDDYLEKTNSEKAPWECFAQNPSPPKNEFKVGNKLETNDPRNTSSICLATIIEIAGPRLRLRLDGTDNRNDFWLMCDSDLLHPFEYSTKNGRKLQPPLGYGNDLSKWPKFLEKILNLSQINNAFAPETAFKQPPIKPLKNFFKISQKLEAVDPKNPDLICPATVKEVTRDKILISFDGWSTSSQFWIHYSSRDLFPCGWCKKTGHVLQHPGFLEEKLKKKTNTPKTLIELSLKKKTTPNDSLNQLDYHKYEPEKKAKDINLLDFVKKEAVEPDFDNSIVNNLNKKLDHRFSPVCLFVNANYEFIKFINSIKFHKSHTKFGPGHPADIYRSIVQSFLDCAVNRMEVFHLIPDGNGVMLLRYKTSSSCLKKKLNLVNSKEEMWKEIRKICEILEIDDSKLFSNKLFKENINLKKSPQTSDSVQIENKENVVAQIKEKIEEFPLTPKASSCSSSTSSFQELIKNHSSKENICQTKRKLSSEENNLYEAHSISKINKKDDIPISEWTIDDVVGFIQSLGDYFISHLEAFKHHEIDGRALLLLNTDILMKYMGFKLGPALKLNNYLESLRINQKQTIYPISLHNHNLKTEKSFSH